MEYFVFNYDKHAHLIDSYLLSSSKSYGDKQKTREWFLWKFRDNPNGETILACASEKNEVVGCVAYALQNFLLDDVPIKGAYSSEFFVNPDFQGKGIFSKLLKLSENEAEKRGAKFLLSFPNKNSLPGLLRKEWKQLDISEYWIKPKSLLRLPRILKNLRQPFVPKISNLNELDVQMLDGLELSNPNSFESEITKEYLEWRFFKFPNTAYLVVEDDAFFSIARVGKRGAITEIQVLLVNWYDQSKGNLKELIKAYKLKTTYDIISFPISKTNLNRRKLRKNLFVRVPNRTNFCYKVLDSALEAEMAQISFSAINFHTY